VRLIALVAAATLGTACGVTPSVRPDDEAAWVGSPACATCHVDEWTAWQPSQHARAMQPATDSTVLGNFSSTSIRRAKMTTTFFRREGRFMVRTNGPDGRLAEFEITHTFGVEPLQQYLIPMPGGRLQAFGIAWDSRAADQGGQRWFALSTDLPPAAGDPFHWTGYQQTWNHQCADCHSTNLRKGWNDSTASYTTTWSEISVGCEACHGPGSDHLAWAHARESGGVASRYQDMGLVALLDERRGVSWTTNPSNGKPTRSAPRITEREIDTCARCHARRDQLTDAVHPGDPLLNGFRPAVIESGLYYPDGQMRAEVYTWGSFLQSRMYSAGVTCSDCHEPHGGKLRAPGAQVCARCHTPAQYATSEHHLHQPDGPGADCVACHMPTVRYMVVDPRHDHAFRVPRPDLSGLTGAPDTCTACHTDRPASWAATQLENHLGHRPGGFQSFAEAFTIQESGGSGRLLTALLRDPLQPAIVRASALFRLQTAAGSASLPEVTAALSDRDPLVRAAAVQVVAAAPLADRSSLLITHLRDPIRLIRMEAARGLAGTPDGQLHPEDQTARQAALAEYFTSQEFLADRPESWANLGDLRAEQGNIPGAIDALRTALERDSAWAPAWVNLADLYRSIGQDGTARRVLEAARLRNPENAAIAHALGLALIRSSDRPAALAALADAARLDPASSRYSFIHAVALHDLGRPGEAIAALRTSRRLHPRDQALAEALLGYLIERGDAPEARRVLQEVMAGDPANPAWRDWAARVGGQNPTP
jgi:predicted CXXCH cytochrome family protein